MLPLPLLTADSSMRPSKRQLCAGSERRPYDAQAVLNATGHAQAAQPRSCCLILSCTWCSLVLRGCLILSCTWCSLVLLGAAWCSLVQLLGCIARRAVLGIHRTQAGRSGSSSGRGWRVVARCTTTTPSINSATSVTGHGCSAAGRCRLCARPGAGPGEKPPPPLPAAVAGPGAVRHRHRSWAAVAGPDAVPRRGQRNPGRRTRRRHRTRSPLRAGVGAARTAVRAGLSGPLTPRTDH
jgi:hypothetical protein